MRVERLWPYLRLLAPGVNPSGISQTRWIHKTRNRPKVPGPRPFVPDVETFLTLIGRDLNKYASKFPTWESLFSLTTPELKDLGIEPPRRRRYLVQWMQRYREGALGPGGDFEYVKDGAAILKIALPPASKISDARWVVNVPHDEQSAEAPSKLQRPLGYTVRGLKSIAGPYAKVLPGRAGAVVKATPGMWEQKQGRKIDGGERRRDEVRFKRRSAERRAELEAEALEGTD